MEKKDIDWSNIGFGDYPVSYTHLDVYKRQKQYNGAAIHSFNDLKIGDYVVHENHGLGIYQGIEKIEKDHGTKDYLKVAYAAGSNLYVPATSLEAVSYTHLVSVR